MKVRPPATYQGGKQRLAEQIVAIVQSEWHRRTYSDFADLCCGSGAVAIAARLDGIPAASIIMIDAGPWGSVWAKVAAGKFSLETLRRIAAAVPKDPEHQAAFIRELLLQPAHLTGLDMSPILIYIARKSKLVWFKSTVCTRHVAARMRARRGRTRDA